MITLGIRRLRQPAEAIRKVEELSQEAAQRCGPGLARGMYRVASYAQLEQLRMQRALNRHGGR